MARYPDIQILGHNQIATKHKVCPRFFVPAYARKLGYSEDRIFQETKYMKEGEGYASVENIIKGNISQKYWMVVQNYEGEKRLISLMK